MSTELDRLRKALDEAARCWDADRCSALAAELDIYLRDGTPAEPATFVRVLKEAVDNFNRRRVAQLCREFVKQLWNRTDPYPFDEAKAVLDALRRKRYFDQMSEVADVLIQTGQDRPRILRLYAQALLDRGRIMAGIAILQDLRAKCESSGDQEELAEAIGLLGRAYKQIYLDASEEGGQAHRGRSLQTAIATYAIPYLQDPDRNHWHGINTVALICRAQRDGVKIDPAPLEVPATARRILDRIANQESPSIWECATAAEACLALRDYDQAFEWVGRYTREATADAFEYASTLRQFEELWQLDPATPAEARILHILRETLLQREGGGVEMNDPAVELRSANTFLQSAEDLKVKDPVQFEKVFGAERYKSFQWYVEGINQARGVAKIEDAVGNGHGTGFLVPGQDIHPGITDEWVLVTNAHVISEDPSEHAGNPPSLPPGEVQVRFDASEFADQIFEVDSVLFSSGRHALDCTIVSLRTPIPFAHTCKLSKHLPLADGKQRVYVIGHPKGGKLSFSLHDNILLDHQIPKIHYRAPTEGGSSGSPVFNSTWRLIGLHHAGGSEMKRLNAKPGVYEANEGIRLQSIIEAVAEKLG